MKINIVTSELKKANRNLNISLLTFGLFMLLFFISFWFPNSDLMKSVYLISLFTSCGLILISFLFLIFRQTKKRSIELDANQLAELIINTQMSAEKISKKSEIEYLGNEIKTNMVTEIFEVSNSTAFELLHSGIELKITTRSKKNNGMNMSPKELINDLMSTLWASS
jgi:hypothetical protein